MPCVVDLEYGGEIIMKSTWCENFIDAELVNGGYNTDKKMKIFYSPNKVAKPNFQLEPREEFNDNIAAVYYGYILEVFGEFFRSRSIFLHIHQYYDQHHISIL